MARKHDVNKINLEVTDIDVFPPQIKEDGTVLHNGCIRIYWISDRGFGQYDLFKGKDDKWYGDSEHMDSQEDKDFIKKLMELVCRELIIYE